jgi:hypothetical protein
MNMPRSRGVNRLKFRLRAHTSGGRSDANRIRGHSPDVLGIPVAGRFAQAPRHKRLRQGGPMFGMPPDASWRYTGASHEWT